MRFTSRLARLLPGFLAPWLVCGVVRAQIQEEKATLGLEEGLLYHHDGTLSEETTGDSKVPDVGTRDFSVCFWIPANAPRDLPSLAFCNIAKTSGIAGWSISTGDSVVVTLQSPELKEPIKLSTPPVRKGEGPHHIAVVIKRDARQPLSGISVDGVESVSSAVPPVNLSCADASLRFKGDGTHGVQDVRIYHRALTRSEILDLMWLPPGDSPKSKHPAPPPNGPRFIPQPDETIALIGGTEAVALAESGELEALLLMAFPNTHFHFRCLAWEGDTVFRQDRPMNFGSLEQQLRRIDAGAVFVMFGRQECLDAAPKNETQVAADVRRLKSSAPDASPTRESKSLLTSAATRNLDEFKTAFAKLLATVEKVTPNIVVIGPPPFEKKQPPLPDVSPLNGVLKIYNEKMEEEAGKLGAVFGKILDAKNAHFFMDVDPKGWTTNGVSLNKSGSLITTWVVANDLKW
ncbi:MAG TPA: hypothetical protein VGH65_07010, partial [Verrucomicrobiaceae bacterium]